MKKVIVPALAVLALAACSHKAQDELGEAGNTMSADANATMAKANRDVDAAANQAFGAAENGMDKVGRAANDAKDKAGQALKDAGNEIED